MATKVRKKDYITSIIGRYGGLKASFKEVEKMRKNHKERINPAYTSGITSIKNLAGTYKRGSRAGMPKVNEKALTKLTLNELKRLDRLMELQGNKQMYSAIDRKIRENAWDLAYTSFKNASKYKGKRAEEIEKRRRELSEEDYRNMVYLFEKMEGDFLHAYGSEVAEQLYEETNGEIDSQTLYDVMREGIEIGRVAGAYNKKYATRQNEVAQEFVWFWSGYVFDEPDTDLDYVIEEFKESLINGEI